MDKNSMEPNVNRNCLVTNTFLSIPSILPYVPQKSEKRAGLERHE